LARDIARILMISHNFRIVVAFLLITIVEPYQFIGLVQFRPASMLIEGEGEGEGEGGVGEGVRVSRATVIMISSLLDDSSDSLDAVSVWNDLEDEDEFT